SMRSSALVCRLPGCWPVSRAISRLRRLLFRDGGNPRPVRGARVFWQSRVRKRNRARQLGEQLVLRAQLQMQVQQDDKADAGPHVEDKVGPAANSDELRHTRGMRWKPNEVEAHKAHDARQDRHDWRSSILRPCIEENDAE